MSDFDQYSRHFSTGMKVGVGIPLPNAEVYRDWAVIRDLDEDFVSLQLSRDQLPERISLHIGQIIEIRGGAENTGFCVRGIIVNEGYAKELLLRLIGEVVSDELREFYRIDAFLPVKYYLSHEQRLDVLEKQWYGRRLDRLENEQHLRQQQWSSRITDGDAKLPNERQLDDPDDSWQTIVPLAANISGGGIRIVTHQSFTSGENVLLEIFVPSPPRIIEAVGRVAFADSITTAGTDQGSFDTGFQFVFIDEHDRDVIIRYVSSVQLHRMRQLRETYLYEPVEAIPESSNTGLNWQVLLKRLVTGLVVMGIAWLLISYLRGYSVSHPKHEIEQMFENGIRRYMERQK